MIKIPISEIIVTDRIRKNMGDIESLASNIQELGLLAPIVVNQNHKLLAGERRLEACKSLGWTEIDAIVKNTEDAAQELDVEISENKNRKSFTREEEINAGIELERIEKVKAEERHGMRTDLVQNFAPSSEFGKTREIVAGKLGMSHTQYEKEKLIVQNKDLLPPGMYDDWNNRIISTNRLHIELKNILSPEKKKESQPKVQEVEVVPKDYESLKKEKEELTEQLASANAKLEQQPEQVKEVIKEVAPADYEELKKQNKDLLDEKSRYDSWSDAIMKRNKFYHSEVQRLTKALNEERNGRKSMIELENEIFEELDLEEERDALKKEVADLKAQLEELSHENEKNKIEVSTYTQGLGEAAKGVVNNDAVFAFYERVKDFQNKIILPFLNSDVMLHKFDEYDGIVVERLEEACNSSVYYFNEILKRYKTKDADIIDMVAI